MVGIKENANAQRELHVVLEWLWDVAVSCILNELGSMDEGSGIDVCSRVWWVGNGLLNILPIHAAGYHQFGSTKNAMDRVISSYTPTLKALLYARERSLRVATVELQKAMLVGMPKTPAQGELPFVAIEIKELNGLLSPHIETTVVDPPERVSVLSALRGHQIVHFSCHGYSSSVNPSDSRLLLRDWQITPLTVSDLTALNIQFAQFAFLSACHSASIRDFRLLSESISLSSAIQLAGYPSVVGTLWHVSDERSVEIAKDVYAGMLVAKKLDPQRSAESLHHAVRNLRERTRTVPGFRREVPDNPLIWAPFIHLGV